MIKKIVLNGRTIEYTLVRKKVKNINLRIKPDGSIFVSANSFVAQSRIDDFLISHAERILSTLDKFKSIAENQPKEQPLDDGNTLWILGREKHLRLITGNKNGVELLENTVALTVTDTADTALKRKTIEAWSRTLCKQIVTDICKSVYPIFEKQGVPFPEIKFRKMKGCWGNCRPKGAVLTFNTRLICYPTEAIEYVVMHEFTHFLQPDHSKEFYKILASYMPDWKQRRGLLYKHNAF